MAEFIYLDIETLPTQDGAIREKIAAGVQPPGNISKAETIAKWEAETKPLAVKKAVAETSFDGGLGHVCCIGWAVGEANPEALIIDKVRDEAAMMRGAFDAIAKARSHYAAPVIVGHNVAAFDIRFLWQRAFALGVVMPPWFPRDPKPWSEAVHDTMAMWAGARDSISMDRLCAALGLDGKGNGISGAEVADRWAAGEFEKIAQYCADDVARTRAIHRKMLIAMGQIEVAA
jgi:DNA polymerase elongation subunit (family B)